MPAAPAVPVARMFVRPKAVGLTEGSTQVCITCIGIFVSDPLCPTTCPDKLLRVGLPDEMHGKCV